MKNLAPCQDSLQAEFVRGSFNRSSVYSVRLDLVAPPGAGAASLQSVVSQAVAVGRTDEETNDDLPNPPPCLFDCAWFDVVFEGDVDDCAVVAGWSGKACMRDCSAEDVSVYEALRTLVCSFADDDAGDGYGSFLKEEEDEDDDEDDDDVRARRTAAVRSAADDVVRYAEVFTNHLLFEPDFVPSSGVPKMHLESALRLRVSLVQASDARVVIDSAELELRSVLQGVGYRNNTVHPFDFRGAGHNEAVSLSLRFEFAEAECLCHVKGGGGLVRIEGLNFALTDPNSLTFAKLYRHGDSSNPEYVPVHEGRSAVDAETVTVRLPPGIGIGHGLSVAVCRSEFDPGSSSSSSAGVVDLPGACRDGSIAESARVRFDYADPYIRSVGVGEATSPEAYAANALIAQNAGSDANAAAAYFLRLTVVGQNFGDVVPQEEEDATTVFVQGSTQP